MNSNKLITRTFFVLILFSSILDAQGQTDLLQNEKLLNVAKNIMHAASNCSLITLDSDGLPAVRIMDPHTPDSNMTIWFGTNPNSRKVGQIRRNPMVTLHYFDAKNPGYVTIRGMASFIQEKNLKKAYFKPEWTEFYPDVEKDFMLIKVEPIWLEVISTKDGIIGDSITWQPPRIKFTEE